VIRLLRSIIDFEDGKIDPEALSVNFRYLLGSNIQWNRPDDEQIFRFVKSYFEHNLPNLPSAQTVEDYFTKANNVEALERLKDIEGQPVYTYANYGFLLKQLLDDQNKVKMLKLLKDAQEVVSKGMEVQEGREKKIYRGTSDAHLFYSARAVDLLPREANTRTRGNLRVLTDNSWEAYLAAKHDKSKAYGKLTGINDIDKVCRGIKRGEMWVHAGFAGELKSTFALNWAYNLVTRFRANVFYVSLEMPLEQIQRIIHVLHSANGKFAAMGYEPLDYRKVRDGELSLEEEKFYDLVLNDFANNPEYARFEIWCPDRDVTLDDIRIEAELMHRQMEIGLLVIDHGGLVKPRRHNTNYTIELNSVLRDGKKLALHFNGGEGIPLLMLFQINRDGKDQADKADGVYKMRALSYANEAERSADVITTTYLNQAHRQAGTTVCCNLKNRDNPLFDRTIVKVNFTCRRLKNFDVTQVEGHGMGCEDPDDILSMV